MNNLKTKKGTLEISAYHFNPNCTNNYASPEQFVKFGDNLNPVPKEVKLEEFEDVLKAGYFNTVILENEHINWEEIWEMVEKYDLTVWYDIFELFDSKKGSVEDFFKPYLDELQIARSNPKYWERFNGFVFDENCHRGQTPEDFNATCKYLYEQTGKRNFPVFAPNEITTMWHGPGQDYMTPAAFEYVTDVAFDVYAVDVRDGATNGFILRDAHNAYPEITDGKSFFKVLMDGILEMAGHPVNVWFYPCSQERSIPGGVNGATRNDEDFVMSQLNFFDELMRTYDYYGGIILYSYAQWGANEHGLQSLIDVQDENGNQKIRPEDNQVWPNYSKQIREFTEKYRNSEVTLISEPVK